MTGEIRESTTLSRCDFSLFKGIYNKVIFNIKSNDNIDITTFPHLYINFIKNEEVIYKGKLIKERHYYVFDDVMQADMDLGTYEYVVTTDTIGVLYADQNFAVRGYFQVKKGLPDEVKPVVAFDIEKQTMVDKKILYVSNGIALPYSSIGQHIIMSGVLPMACVVRVYGTLVSSPTADLKLWSEVYSGTIIAGDKLDINVAHKLEYVFLEIEPVLQSSDVMPDLISIKIF